MARVTGGWDHCRCAGIPTVCVPTLGTYSRYVSLPREDPTMTWTSFHRRGDVLRDVIAVADQRRDGTLPRDVDGVSATFADDLDLLGALQLKWHTRLAGRIDREQMHQPMDLET